MLTRTLGLTAGLAILALAPSARADALSAGELTRLGRGETVIREHTWEPGRSARFVGGVTYTIVDAPASEVLAMFDDVDAYRRVLPSTKAARFVGAPGSDRLVELVQGNAMMDATYTIRVRPDAATGAQGRREFRFWLEQSRPHEIDDAWGFFRIEPFFGEGGERVLLTYAILVDIGPGIVRDLFEDRARAAFLSVPQLVRRYVAEARR
ncbi:MAG: hypothetical protein JWP97_406 [Labilithrix sp.]|nr:hypothetical protein [Labilithrix sp.]